MKILKLWYSIIGLHALHQIEESISFFHWELAHVGNIPDWLLFNLKLLDVVGDYQQQNFFVSSFFQILITSTIVFAFRKNLKITKILMVVYLCLLRLVFSFHILQSIVAQSVAPVMVTCIGGLYILPFIFSNVINLKK